MLKPAPFSTFQQYAENSLMQYICAELNNVNRVDIVWDQYLDNSLKKQLGTNVVDVLKGKKSPSSHTRQLEGLPKKLLHEK